MYFLRTNLFFFGFRSIQKMLRRIACSYALRDPRYSLCTMLFHLADSLAASTWDVCMYFYFISFSFQTDEVHQSGSAGRILYYFAKDNMKRQYFISRFPDAADSPVKCACVTERATSRGIHLYP